MRGPVKVLNPENLEGLETGQQLFITTWVAKSVLLSDAPCMVVGRNGDDFLAIYITAEGDGAQVQLPVSEYGKTWNASISDGFAIRTPGGPLIATPYIDPEYPGIEIWRADPKSGEAFQRLALVEYTPGGEGLCGFDPDRPNLAKQEIAEVPVERIAKRDGEPIESKDSIYPHNAGEYEVTPGFVTRAWPNDIRDEDDHRRVFHTDGES